MRSVVEYSLSGTDAAGAAYIIAAHLKVFPHPLTVQLAQLAGRPIVRRAGPPPVRTVTGHWQRPGTLITEDGITAARTMLAWDPAAVPEQARSELEAGMRPAGLILAGLPGFARLHRTGVASGARVDASAELYLGDVRVGHSSETVTEELCAAAAAYWAANPPGGY
jgi:hypothetical protein